MQRNRRKPNDGQLLVLDITHSVSSLRSGVCVRSWIDDTILCICSARIYPTIRQCLPIWQLPHGNRKWNTGRVRRRLGSHPRRSKEATVWPHFQNANKPQPFWSSVRWRDVFIFAFGMFTKSNSNYCPNSIHFFFPDAGCWHCWIYPIRTHAQRKHTAAIQLSDGQHTEEHRTKSWRKPSESKPVSRQRQQIYYKWRNKINKWTLLGDAFECTP